MPTLGVNIDHVATIRQARRTDEPDPVLAAREAEAGGADQITVHLRQDRRHIQDYDVTALAESVTVRLNLECACVDEMLELAEKIRPHQVCLVPEKREEVTTEGGLDIVSQRSLVQSCVQRLNGRGILTSLFIDPEISHIKLAHEMGAGAVELHTGTYANAKSKDDIARQMEKLEKACAAVLQTEMHLHAGHGLTYQNVVPVARIPGMEELNIGHTIVSRSVFVGIRAAVEEMKQLIA